jgi:hypothetical protein
VLLETQYKTSTCMCQTHQTYSLLLRNLKFPKGQKIFGSILTSMGSKR